MYLASLINKGKAAYERGTTDPTALPADTLLQMATINGAKTVLWADEIGSLEVGKKVSTCNQAPSTWLIQWQCNLIWNYLRLLQYVFSVFSAHYLRFSCYTCLIEKSWGWACNFGAPRWKNLSPYMCLNWWSLKFVSQGWSLLYMNWNQVRWLQVQVWAWTWKSIQNEEPNSFILGTYKGSNSFTLAHQTCNLEHLSWSYVWLALQDLSSTEGGKLYIRYVIISLHIGVLQFVSIVSVAYRLTW